MIIYIANPNKSTIIFLELNTGFCKVTRYKVNTQKFVVFLMNNVKLVL